MLYPKTQLSIVSLVKECVSVCPAGVTLQREQDFPLPVPLVILPYMKHRDLRRFLIATRYGDIPMVKLPTHTPIHTAYLQKNAITLLSIGHSYLLPLLCLKFIIDSQAGKCAQLVSVDLTLENIQTCQPEILIASYLRWVWLFEGIYP